MALLTNDLCRFTHQKPSEASTNPTLRGRSAGFTLIEMLIIAPIVILFVGVMIVMLTNVTGESLVNRERNSMAYEVQDALDLVETEGARSATYPATTGTLTSPQGSNDTAAAFTVADNDTSQTDNDVLIIKTPATDLSPLNASRTLIFKDTPNACASASVTQNDYYPITTVYFVASGSLWQRTILPSTVTPCSTPWQRSSCAISQPLTGVCKAYDNKLVSNVTSFSVQYLKVDGTPLASTKSASAKAVNISIKTSKQVAGQTINYAGTNRSVAMNETVSAPTVVTLNYTGSIQNWTVPADITSITITAKGAQGGSGTTYTGGLGASMQGTFAVTPGQVLKILVGQQGVNDTSYKAGGGGGGTFVTTSANSPLIVAGGGGGGGGNSNPSNGNPGLTSTTGGSSASFSGGTAGGGGGGTSGSSGGGGLTGNGTSSGSTGPGLSFTNGGTGGAAALCGSGNGKGGFGGGSGGEWCNQGAPGAGGGYSGGAGTNQYGVSGGGGSYNSGTAQVNASGVQSGNGQVKISMAGEGGGSSGGGGVGTNTADFNYTGAQQTWTVPSGINTIQLETWGAEGGEGKASNNPILGGLGGYAKGTLTVTPGETLYIYVGSKGGSSTFNSVAGGFNGGGSGYFLNSTYDGSGGGGASDVRRGGNALSDRKVVAGGGGGGTEGGSGFYNQRLGGDGGGTSGGSTVNAGSMSPASGGGTQSSGGNGGAWGGHSAGYAGTLGQGGNASNSNPSSGGGGGYYGGGAGTYISGGGGSSYIGGVTSGTTTAGQRSGNGQVKITY